MSPLAPPAGATLAAPRQARAAAWLALALLLVYGALVAGSFGPYLSDDHAFRQTQTAIIARYFSGGGDWLAYQMPVFGAPWAMPFEFPLYQALAKGLQLSSGLSLETSGRLVSMAFFLLCFWPLHDVLRRWGLRNTPLVMAPVLLAPLYVLWSRGFMIETTALFFTLAFLALFLRALATPQPRPEPLLLLLAAGGLAALVKVTTLLPVMAVTLLVNAVLLVLAWRRRQPLAGLLWLAAAQALVLALGATWVLHADGVRLNNPIGPLLTSGALRDWNFGTLAQRLDPKVWAAIASNVIEILFPLSRPLAMLKYLQLLGWLALFAYFFAVCTPTRRRQVLLLGGLFLLPFAVFTNLHRVHNYYQSANAVFLCLAFGLAACGAVEAAADARRARLRLGLYATALLIFGLNSAWYLQFKRSDVAIGLALPTLVQKLSPEGSVIVITGMDFSSVLPYQAGRRALMLPDRIGSKAVSPAMASASLQALRDSAQPASLYVACGEPASVLDPLVRDFFALGGREPDGRADECALYRL